MPPEIAVQANTFARELTRLFQLAVGPHITFGATSLDRGATILIGPNPFEKSRHSRVPMARSGADAPLELTVEYRVQSDEEGQWMTVAASTFGLWITARGKPRPVVRIEYERDARGKPPAHVHFHAESTEVGWLYGRAGMPAPRLQEFHFPLGGRRFRPTVEDFLEFLDREGVYRDWFNKSGMKATLTESRAAWERRQAKATARRNPAAVVEYLESQGYSVTPPATTG